MSGINPQTPTVVYVEKKSGWGCFFYGCLIVLVVLFLLTVATIVGGYWLATSTVRQYTSTSPAVIPPAQITTEELNQIESTVASFKEEIKKGNTPPPLVLTAEQINGMIERNNSLKGRAHVSIQDGLVTGEISIPADKLPMGIGKGRYFNASATLNVSIDDGVLDVRVVDAAVNGKPIPANILTELAKQNLAADVAKDPKAKAAIEQFDKLEVLDDKIILTPSTKPRTDHDVDSHAEAEPVKASAP